MFLGKRKQNGKQPDTHAEANALPTTACNSVTLISQKIQYSWKILKEGQK